MDRKIKKILLKLYTTPGPAYLSNQKVLYTHAKELNPAIKLKDVKKFLASSHVSSLSKGPSTSKKEYLPYATTAPHQSWSMDLMFYRLLPFLVIVDTFSGAGWIRKIKNKKPESVLEGLKYIVAHYTHITPAKIYSDKGGEFMGPKLQNYFEEHQITHKMLKSNQKASTAERMIRKIRRIWRKMQLYKNVGSGIKAFEQGLPDIMHTINTTKQTRTKLAPADVLKDLSLSGKNFSAKYAKRLRNNYEGVEKSRFSIGSKVRIRPFPGANPFKKSLINSNETFTVYKIFASRPVTYMLKDYQDKILDKTFYDRDLVKAELKSEKNVRVVQVLTSRTVRGGRRQFYVLLTSGDKTWISQEELNRLKKQEIY